MPVAGGARLLPGRWEVALFTGVLHEGLGVVQRDGLHVGLRALGVLASRRRRGSKGALVGCLPPAVAGVAALGVLGDEAVLGELAQVVRRRAGVELELRASCVAVAGPSSRNSISIFSRVGWDEGASPAADGVIEGVRSAMIANISLQRVVCKELLADGGSIPDRSPGAGPVGLAHPARSAPLACRCGRKGEGRHLGLALPAPGAATSTRRVCRSAASSSTPPRS